MAFLQHSTDRKNSASHQEPEDVLWDKISPDLEALENICTRLGSQCFSKKPLNHGAYARVFHYTLDNDRQLVARVILPVREIIKTESEIAAMDMVRGMSFLTYPIDHSNHRNTAARTSIPVPKVYLFCSTPHNPVKAEWIFMDLVPGQRFVDCFGELGYEQKTKMATDLARIVSDLFSITSNYCGSLLQDHTLSEAQRSPRYTNTIASPTSGEPHSVITASPYSIGPFNDIVFLTLNEIVPASSCGPFPNERQFLEACVPRRTCDTPF
jgi:hypothetical protein